MKNYPAIFASIAILILSVAPTFAQQNISLANNAAFRYWAAFSEVQDAAITDQQAKELNLILEGTAPYVDSKHKDLLARNAPALEIMARATSLPKCDWGLDYGLGEDLPVEYAKKAIVLGRLNVLYTFHLFIVGNNDAAIRALVAGLRFSRDVGQGGTLFATLVAKDLLVNHLRAVSDALAMDRVSAQQKVRLQNAVSSLGKGLDWGGAARRDLEALRGRHATELQASAALTRISSSYVAFLDDQSKLAALNKAIENAPQQLAALVPNAQRVLEQKQDLIAKLSEARSSLQR